jgi:bleomycin hydrolase
MKTIKNCFKPEISILFAVILLSGCGNNSCCEKSQKTEKKSSNNIMIKQTLKPNGKSGILEDEKQAAKPKSQLHKNKKYDKPLKLPPFIYKHNKNGSNTIVYQPKKKDDVLEEMKKNFKKEKADNSKALKEIRDLQKVEKEDLKKKRTKLRTDIGTLSFPKSKTDFTLIAHNPPVPQFYTGTCWSFASTSFFESEIMRMKKLKIKLSEMWTVYWTYIEKSRRYIKRRGDSFVAEGDEPNNPTFIWKKYGIIPLSDYSGLVNGKKRHDHRKLIKELKSYLKFVNKNNLWSEEWNLKHIKLILNKHLGTPPTSIKYNNLSITPLSFLKDVTGLNMDDYVSVISTSAYPFYSKQILNVPDNWSKNKNYINVPLDVWFNSIEQGIKTGYSLVLGGDVSEPGKIPGKDLFFIPSFDIPSSLINQSSREFRIYNSTTTDDHGIHLVGLSKKPGWFIIKDSGRSSRWGKAKGYYFVSYDYTKLKILTWFGHKKLAEKFMAKLK